VKFEPPQNLKVFPTPLSWQKLPTGAEPWLPRHIPSSVQELPGLLSHVSTPQQCTLFAPLLGTQSSLAMSQEQPSLKDGLWTDMGFESTYGGNPEFCPQLSTAGSQEAANWQVLVVEDKHCPVVLQQELYPMQ